MSISPALFSELRSCFTTLLLLHGPNEIQSHFATGSWSTQHELTLSLCVWPLILYLFDT